MRKQKWLCGSRNGAHRYPIDYKSRRIYLKLKALMSLIATTLASSLAASANSSRYRVAPEMLIPIPNLLFAASIRTLMVETRISSPTDILVAGNRDGGEFA